VGNSLSVFDLQNAASGTNWPYSTSVLELPPLDRPLIFGIQSKGLIFMSVVVSPRLYDYAISIFESFFLAVWTLVDYHCAHLPVRSSICRRNEIISKCSNDRMPPGGR
jgi:hypothetical protein